MLLTCSPRSIPSPRRPLWIASTQFACGPGSLAMSLFQWTSRFLRSRSRSFRAVPIVMFGTRIAAVLVLLCSCVQSGCDAERPYGNVGIPRMRCDPSPSVGREKPTSKAGPSQFRVLYGGNDARRLKNGYPRHHLFPFGRETVLFFWLCTPE